jgi:hypothetical protein
MLRQMLVHHTGSSHAALLPSAINYRELGSRRRVDQRANQAPAMADTGPTGGRTLLTTTGRHTGRDSPSHDSPCLLPSGQH